MAFVGNLLWFVFGGGFLGCLLWALLGVIFAITIIGIPFALAAFRIASFAAFPFGRDLIDARLVGEQRVKGTGFVNFLWIVFAGLWLAIFHALVGVGYCLSLIGIPFGLAHLKLSKVCFAPLGKRIVSKEMAAVAKTRHVNEQLDARLGKQVRGDRAVHEVELQSSQERSRMVNPAVEKTDLPNPRPTIADLRVEPVQRKSPTISPATPEVGRLIQSQAAIYFDTGEFAGKSFPLLPHKDTIIGRDPLRAAIVLSHPKVSRAHVMIRYDPESECVLVQDLESSYGVSVDEKRLERGGKALATLPLRVELGDNLVTFMIRNS